MLYDCPTPLQRRSCANQDYLKKHDVGKLALLLLQLYTGPVDSKTCMFLALLFLESFIIQ